MSAPAAGSVYVSVHEGGVDVVRRFDAATGAFVSTVWTAPDGRTVEGLCSTPTRIVVLYVGEFDPIAGASPIGADVLTVGGTLIASMTIPATDLVGQGCGGLAIGAGNLFFVVATNNGGTTLTGYRTYLIADATLVDYTGDLTGLGLFGGQRVPLMNGGIAYSAKDNNHAISRYEFGTGALTPLSNGLAYGYECLFLYTFGFLLVTHDEGEPFGFSTLDITTGAVDTQFRGPYWSDSSAGEILSAWWDGTLLWCIAFTGGNYQLAAVDPVDSETIVLEIVAADLGHSPTFVTRVLLVPDVVTAIYSARDGLFWQAIDSSARGASNLNGQSLALVGPPPVSLPVPFSIGNGVGCSHDLMDLPSGDFLTINRATGDLVRISLADGSLAQTYGLNVSTLDAAVNDAGTRLLYLDGAAVKVWDLENDVLLGTLFTAASDLRCLVWLPDCTLVATTAIYFGDGPIIRYRMNGEIVHTYAYDPSTASEGQYGIAASVETNELFVVFDWDRGQSTEQPGVLRFNLASGALIPLSTGPVVPLVGELSDADVVSPITQPYVAIACTPFPPAPPAPVAFVIRRLRRFMLPWDESNRIKFCSRLELVGAAGLGDVAGSDPVIMLRFSKDGGYTWGDEIQMTAGKLGDYAKRMYVNRLPAARNPVVEITTTDPAAWAWVEALADMTDGTS